MRLFGAEERPGYGHLELARSHDLTLVAPASANTVARMAAGLADGLPSPLSNLPLGEQGLAWLVPCVMTLVVAVVCDRLLGKREEALA